MSQIKLLKHAIKEHTAEMRSLVNTVAEFYKSQLPFEHQYFYLRKINEVMHISITHLDKDFNSHSTLHPIADDDFKMIAGLMNEKLAYCSYDIIRTYKNFQITELFEKYLYPSLTSEFKILLTTRYISFKDAKMSHYDPNRGFWKLFNEDIDSYILSFCKYNYEDKGLPDYETKFLNKLEAIVATIARSNKSGIYYSKGQVYQFSFADLEQELRSW